MWPVIVIVSVIVLLWIIIKGVIPTCQGKYPEEFLREYKDKINWYIVCKDAYLSEDFIREMEDYVDWEMIFKYQDLSEEFKNEFKHKLQ